MVGDAVSYEGSVRGEAFADPCSLSLSLSHPPSHSSDPLTHLNSTDSTHLILPHSSASRFGLIILLSRSSPLPHPSSSSNPPYLSLLVLTHSTPSFPAFSKRNSSFLAFVTYLLLGSYSNYTQYGATGWDALPHRDVWRDLPFVVGDLFKGACVCRVLFRMCLSVRRVRRGAE